MNTGCRAGSREEHLGYQVEGKGPSRAVHCKEELSQVFFVVSFTHPFGKMKQCRNLCALGSKGDGKSRFN